MEESNMNNGSRKSSKANAISNSKESTKIQFPLSVISTNIKVEIGVNNGGNIILLTLFSEQGIREYGKCASFENVEPVEDRGQNVHDEDKAGCNIGGGKPWAGKWAAQIGWDGGPVEPNRAEAQPVKARAKLLGQNGGGEGPAGPWEWGEDLEEVAREDVIGEAANEGYYEELGSA